MELIVDGYVIEEPILNILYKLRNELTNGKLSVIEQKDEYVRVTCPFHSEGHERHPSCSVYSGDGDLVYGTFHCFTCNERGDLVKFIARCFNESYEYAKQWLLSNYGHSFLVDRVIKLEEIDLTKKKEEQKYLDDSILEEFSNYHPYFEKRHLTDETVEKFELKYDPLTKMVVFPVRDINGKIAFLTRRSTEGKKFFIDKGADKSVIYLLYNIIRDNIKEVVVCEGQFNRLTSWQYGHPRIALLGAGTTEDQIKVLNKTGIRHYILCYDNDPAGRKGASRFKKFIKKDVFVDDVIMPVGKDINDLTKEEFEDLISLHIT